MEEVIIDGKTLNLKKGFGGWRIVYPFKNSDGTLNWFNILTGGSWANLLKVGVIVALLIFLIFAYKIDISACKELIECGAKCPFDLTIQKIIIP